MAKPLLPSLKKGHGVQDPSIGDWDARTADELNKISEGLDVNQIEVQVNSIPDVWARPLLFEMALFNEEHPLHSQILGEWRGLLAMLALKDIKNLNVLTAKKIEIKDSTKQGNFTNNQVDDTEIEIQATEKSYVFLKALESLIPEKTLASGTTWRHLYLFLFKIGHKTRPIGMTSPTTLVITSTNYFNHIDKNKVPWFSDGDTLSNPIGHLSPPEKKAVAGWLDTLSKNLMNHSKPKDTKIWSNISGLLSKFREDLRVHIGNYSEGSSLNIEKTSGVFFYLNKPAGIVKNKVSDVSLVSSVGRNPRTPMLLVDRDIATDWGEDPRNITVWNASTLADIPSNGVISRNQIGSHSVTDAELWRPRELFTERLFVIKSDNAFPGAKKESWLGNNPPQINKQPISIILPIVSGLLEYIDEETLLENMKFEQGADNEITVNLSLTLGSENQSRIYTAKRTYSRNEIIDFEQFPTLEVFPNFKKENWKAYYVAYSADNPKSTFQIKPYSSYVVETKTNASENDDSQINTDWKFEPSVEETKIPISTNEDGERRIWRLESFPNVLVCNAKDENNVNQNAGLLILNAPSQNLRNGNQTHTVGVDFGASGTSIFYSSDGEPKPLTFENRKLSVTALTGTQKSQLFDFFFPPQDFEIPVLSIFQDFNNKSALSDYSAITNGHTYYIEDKKLPSENIFSELKWKEDTQHNNYAKAFLKQICLQTVAELVQEQEKTSIINWKFSYPTAFSTTHLAWFVPIWQSITNDIGELTGIPPESFTEMTESVAAAQFFRSPPTNAQTQHGTVFVDIGSSTSDVSVWQNGDLLWQVSLRFAGQDMFLDYLKQNPVVLEQLGISITDKNHFYAQIDAALRKDGEAIFGRLTGGKFSELKQHLALGLCGLFYYIGLGINCLRHLGFYEKPEMPHFYFAGNGSKMFRWLLDGQNWGDNRSTDICKNLFESVFTKALDNDKLHGFFEIEMSELPKKEAAFGLVCKTTLNDKEKCKKVFAGENFIENDTQYKWSESLEKQRLTDLLQTPARLEKLSEFIEQFNDFAINSENFFKKYDCDERKLSVVRGKLANDLVDLAKQDDDQRIVQPIFILALKHLLRY